MSNVKNSDFFTLNITDAVKAFYNNDLTAFELAKSCVERYKLIEPKVHAWTYLSEDILLEQAENIDKNFKKESNKYMLAGIPIGIKDIFNTYNMPTSMGSPIWEGFMPGNDARVVTNLRREGANIFGKTVTAEFAVHKPGPTLNPHNKKYIAGTSSTGSAVAVATGMVPAAIGSQTAGSTIRPASYSGIYGYKPSFGCIPRTGVLKTLDTLDHVTCLTRSVRDLPILFDVMRVKGMNYPYIFDKFDSNQINEKLNWRVAVVKTPVWSNMETYAKEKIVLWTQALSKLNIEVSFVDLPKEFDQSHYVHNVIYNKALSYYFREEYETKPDQVSDSMKSMIEKGQKIELQKYIECIDKQNLLSALLENFLLNYDIAISPSTSGEAPQIGIKEKSDPCLMWSLCRVPTVHLPLFKGPNQLPFGVQCISKKYNDYLLFQFLNFLLKNEVISDCDVINIS